jgi:hypothetical protein
MITKFSVLYVGQIEQIREFEARYPGLDQMMIHWAEGMPPKEFKESSPALPAT